jgi:hypothetical protein
MDATLDAMMTQQCPTDRRPYTATVYLPEQPSQAHKNLHLPKLMIYSPSFVCSHLTACIKS